VRETARNIELSPRVRPKSFRLLGSQRVANPLTTLAASLCSGPLSRARKCFSFVENHKLLEEARSPPAVSGRAFLPREKISRPKV